MVSEPPIKIVMKGTKWHWTIAEATSTVFGVSESPLTWTWRMPQRGVSILTPIENETSFECQEICITDEPVFLKWFPLLPLYMRQVVQCGDARILTVDFEKVRFRDDKIDKFYIENRWLNWGAKILDSIGFRFKYDYFDKQGIATIENREHLHAALALTAILWHRGEDHG